MKIIACTGDSHCWGQGASLVYEDLRPEWIGGDLRLISFAPPTYPNQLRRMVNKATGSTAYEWRVPEGCLTVTAEAPLRLFGSAELIRVQLFAQTAESEAQIFVDDLLCHTVPLTREDPYNAVVTRIMHPAAGEHTLTVRASKGNVLAYRVEMYSGPFAVVNCGIGSCCTRKFLDVFWEDYAAALKPDIVVIEPNSINDWNTQETPDQVEKHLVEMVNRFKDMNALPLMLTVSPILGSQNLPYCPVDYNEYIEMSRRVAKNCGLMLCDANAEMSRRLQGIPDEEKAPLMFFDGWHPNDLGHRLYAEFAYDGLRRLGVFDK